MLLSQGKIKKKTKQKNREYTTSNIIYWNQQPGEISPIVLLT